MKNSTKLKIIRMVEKLLKYKQPIQLQIFQQERKLIKIQYSCVIPDQLISDNLKQRIVYELAMKIKDYKLTKTITTQDGFGNYILTAEIVVLEPLSEK